MEDEDPSRGGDWQAVEKNLTTGNVLRTIIVFALPYLLSYFLQTLYGMADLFIAGQFIGVDGTTAVANGSQVLYMLTVVIVGLAMGGHCHHRPYDRCEQA